MKQSALIVGSRVKSAIETLGPTTEKLTVGRTQTPPSGRSRPTGTNTNTNTIVHGRSDTDELSLPGWRTPGRGHRASEIHRAVFDPSSMVELPCVPVTTLAAQRSTTHLIN